MTTLRAGLLAGLLLVPSPGKAQPAPEAAAEVRAARLAQNAAIAARQLDSMATFWTTDVVIVSSRGGVLRGKEAYRQAFAGDSSLIYVRTPDRVEISAAWPLAWEEGTWVGQVGTGGPALVGGRYAAQWHRIGGRWLIRSELFVGMRCSGEACGWPVQSP